MGDRAVLHLRNYDNTATFATFYTHSGGSPVYMLSKTATYLTEESTKASPADFAAYFLTHYEDYKLELMEADSEPGDCEHIWTLRWTRPDWTKHPVPVVTVKPHGISEHRTWVAATYTGMAEILTATAHALNEYADNIERVQRENQWSDETTVKFAGSASAIRAEATGYLVLAAPVGAVA